MKKIWKKPLSFLLTLSMIITMMPAVAWAEDELVEETTEETVDESTEDTSGLDGALDIADGSIVITENGYKQGEGDEVEWEDEAHSITITGIATTVNTITVNGGDPEITFDGLNITRTNEVSSGTPVISVNDDAKIKLVGDNTLDSSGATNNNPSIRHIVMTIAENATLTVEGSGSLTVKGSSNRKVVDGEGLLKQESGNLMISGGATETAVTTDLEINGETFSVSYTGNSNAKGIVNKSMKITGGTVDVTAKAIGIQTDKFEMSGGTINSISVDSGKTIFTATTADITGGNVNGYYTGDIDGRVLTTILFGEDYAEKEISVAEGNDTANAWTAKANENGEIITYLDKGTTFVSAKLGGEWKKATVSYGVASFGESCTCGFDGEIAWSDTLGAVTLYSADTEATRNITASYEAVGCSADVHPGFDKVIVAVDSVVDENGNEVNDAAEYENGVLTLKKVDGTASYTVTLKAATENGYVDDKMEVTVETSTVMAFDLTKGSVIFEDGKYTQGDTEYQPTANEQVVVYGNGETGNELVVKSDTANVILDNVNIEYTEGNQGPNGPTTVAPIQVLGGMLNLAMQGENTLIGKGTKIFVGKQDSTNVEDAILNIDCVDTDCTYEDCEHSLTFGGNPGFAATIGSPRNINVAGTININSGNVIIPTASYGAGIGTCGDVETVYDINITGGYVDIQKVGQQSTGIGIGRGGTENTKVDIEITGGKVEIDVPADLVSPTGIGSGESSGTVNIVIGSDDAADNAEPVVNIVNKCGTAIGTSGNANVNTTIEIKNGTVYAEGSVGIGFSMYGSFSKGGNTLAIDIIGGDITAYGSGVGIGAQGPAGYPDAETHPGREMEVSIKISGDAKVDATGGEIAIGMSIIGSESSADIEISGDAEVKATALRQEGRPSIAIGTQIGVYAEKYDELPQEDSSEIKITSPNVTLNAEKPIAAATETELEGPLSYTIETEDGEIEVSIPVGKSATVTDEAVTLPEGTTLIDESGNEATVTTDFVTVPADGMNELAVNEGGSIELPAGTVVTNNGSSTDLELGGSISANGAVTENVSPSAPSTSGSKSSSKKYAVSIDADDIENGSVKLSSSKAKKGATVTITVTPDEGYELDELKVLDDDGNEVELTDKGNGKFTFKMPRGGVEIEASFKEADGNAPLVDDDEKTIVLTIDSKAILIDGAYVVNDVAPIIRGERTVLPIRVIAEALGASITWNAAEQSVAIVKDDMTIVLYIGQAFALVNGNPVELDAPAFIENGRTYLPLRFVSENLGAAVTWDGLARTVTIIG